MDEEVAVLGEVRVERDGVQALLDEAGLHVVAERVDRGEVEERIFLHAAVGVDDLDPADPLDHEDAPGAVAGVGDVDRIAEALGDLDQRDLGIARQLPPGSATWSGLPGTSAAIASDVRASAAVMPIRAGM